MNFANLNGVNIHYQVIGPVGKRPTIVFANSLGTDFRIWRDVIVGLAGDYAFIMYDKRGHGLSDVGEYPYIMEDHIDDLVGLLDMLEVKEAIICGLSVGGLIAQGVHAHRPDLVKALILADTGHKIGNDDMWRDRISAVAEEGIESISEGILERWFTESFRSPDNPAFAGYRNMLERTPDAGYIGTADAIRQTDYTEQAGLIDVPTLCIVGEHDGATPPALVQELADLIPNAQCEVIANAGHLPCIEQPEIMVHIMQKFLKTVLAQPAASVH